MTTSSGESLSGIEQQLEQQIRNLLADEGAIHTPSMPLRKLDEPEVGALRLVSWLYALYRESGKSALQFVSQSGNVRIEPNEEVVSTLRTYFHHHLTDSAEDQATRLRAEAWFDDAREGHPEDSDAAWLKYARRLLDESEELLVRLIEHVRTLESAGMSEVYAQQWRWFKGTSISTWQADRLVAEIADTIGLEGLDATKFRKRHFSDWQRGLRQLTHGVDPERHLRLLIQSDLIEYSQNLPAPLTGDDVMDAMGLPPGPQVGRVLVEIQRLHRASDGTLDRVELLRSAADALGLPLMATLPDEQP